MLRVTYLGLMRNWDLMKKRDFPLKIALKSESIKMDEFLKNLPNKVVNELRKAKANIFMTIIKEGKGNSKLIWKNINKLTKTDSKQNQGHRRELKVKGIITNDLKLPSHLINILLTQYRICRTPLV